MKRIFSTLALVALIPLGPGCKPSASQSTAETRESTAQQLDKVKRETKDVAQDLSDYTYAQKADFIAKMRTQLDQINRDLDQLAATVEKGNATAKAEARPKLQALRDQTAGLAKRLDDAKDAGESTWADVKAGFKNGYSELKDGFQQARQWLSDKIAP